MGKILGYDIIAILSAVAMICWIIAGFYGGMLIWFFSYPIILGPVVVVYIVWFFNTWFSFLKSGYKKNRVKVLSHLAVITTIISVNIYNSEVFKPAEVLSATLHDDLFHYRLTLREEGKCETKISGFMGFEQTCHGNYYFKGDTIIFTKLPYDNDNFIPKVLLLDRKEKALFMSRKKDGSFERKKDLSYFILDSIK